MICFSYSARASPSWSSANLLTTCFSVLLKSNGSHHGKATICPKKFFPFPEIRGIIRVSYASFLIPAKNFAVFGVKFAITIYPRKGTETPTGGSRHRSVKITIYPRKGTETPTGGSRHRSVKITIYPRKGTETFWYSSRQMLRMITIYPRKGTETQYFVTPPARASNYYNLSPQGDKKAPLPLAFASSGGALLFLIFYFTGWELRLPESSL